MTILSVPRQTDSKSKRDKEATRNVLQLILVVLMVMMEIVAIIGCVIPYTAKAQKVDGERIPFRHLNGDAWKNDDSQSDKYLFILNKDPQCHSCEEALYHYLGQFSRQRNLIFIVWCDVENALLKREKLSAALHSPLQTDQVLFVLPNDMPMLVSLLHLESYPALLLYDKKRGQTEVLSGLSLYVDDYASSSLCEEAQKCVRRFLK